MFFFVDWGNILILKIKRRLKIGINSNIIKSTIAVYLNSNISWKFNEVIMHLKSKFWRDLKESSGNIFIAQLQRT